MHDKKTNYATGCKCGEEWCQHCNRPSPMQRTTVGAQSIHRRIVKGIGDVRSSEERSKKKI